MKKVEEIKVTQWSVCGIICDVCKKEIPYSDVFEFQEVISIQFCGGYSSVFGDMNTVKIDMCQQCFLEKLGDYCRINEEEDFPPIEVVE